MKKPLRRVLLGLGALLLLGAGVVGVWLFKPSSVTRSQQQALLRLQERYPFTPPGEEGALALSEERLLDYLAIRERALPAVEALASKRVQLQEERSKEGSRGGPWASLEASRALGLLATQARAAWLEGLEQHRMSPDEFRHLTRLIYDLHEQNLREEPERVRAEEQQGVRKALAELQARMRDDSLSAEQRMALEMKESQYKAWLKALEVPARGKPLSEEARAIHQANRALVKKHVLRVAEAYDATFDDFISAQGTR